MPPSPQNTSLLFLLLLGVVCVFSWTLVDPESPLLSLPTLSSGSLSAQSSGIVPCGNRGETPCNLCSLYTLAKNIIDFILFKLILPVAVVAMLIGGIYLLASRGNPQMIETGKSAITNTIIGLIIAFGSWLVIATILNTLGYKGFTPAWNEAPQCKASTAGTASPTGGGHTGTFTGNINGPGLADGYDTTTPEAQALLNEPPEGSSWDQDPKNSNCVLANLSPYSASIQQAAAANGVSPARISGIIMAESSGNPNAVSPKGAYGLMQVLPSTARGLDSSNTGLSDSQIVAKLKNPDYNIQIGTSYYKQLSNEYGNNKDLASAAYNGGPNANKPSVNCPGIRRWQCPWDSSGCYNTGVTSCTPNSRPGHSGYGPTRSYVPNINNLETKAASNCN